MEDSEKENVITTVSFLQERHASNDQEEEVQNKQNNVLVQKVEIDQPQCAPFNGASMSHQNNLTRGETAKNFLKKAVIKIKKLTNKEIEAHSYAGKYCLDAKRKTKKKHKKNKKDREKHKNSLKFTSGSEENVVKTRKTTRTKEISTSKKRSLDKSYSILKEKKAETSYKKVKMQLSIPKPSSTIKRKKHSKDIQLLSFQEQLFYPPDRLITITKDKKIKTDRQSSVSEVNYPAKDANIKKAPDTSPSKSLSCGKQVATNQNKNGKTEKVNYQTQSLQNNSAQKKLVKKSAIENKERTQYDEEINAKKTPPLVPESSLEDSSDDSSSLFSTDSSLPMNILELLFESESSPSEFEGF